MLAQFFIRRPVFAWVIAIVIDKLIGLRVDEETEIVGLDNELHGEKAYHG